MLFTCDGSRLCVIYTYMYIDGSLSNPDNLNITPIKICCEEEVQRSCRMSIHSGDNFLAISKFNLVSFREVMHNI